MSIITGTIIELAANSTACIGNYGNAIGKELETALEKALGVSVWVRNVHEKCSSKHTMAGDLRVGRGNKMDFHLTLESGHANLSIWDGPVTDHTEPIVSFDLAAPGADKKIYSFYIKALDKKEADKAKWYKKVTPAALKEVKKAANNLSKVLKKHRLELVSDSDSGDMKVVPKGVTVNWDMDDDVVLDESRFPSIELPIAGCFDCTDSRLVMPDKE